MRFALEGDDMVPLISGHALLDRTHPGHGEALELLADAANEIGFAVISNGPISAFEVAETIGAYRRFFRLSDDEKSAVDMALTGSNRGWGGQKSEQVDPKANPDFKEVFDCGYAL